MRAPGSRVTSWDAITRGISLLSGAAQRASSAISTVVGEVRSTSCGRSTISGTDTGPTTIDAVLASVVVSAVAGSAASVKKREGGDVPQPAIKVATTVSARSNATWRS